MPLSLSQNTPVDRNKYRPLRKITRAIVLKAQEILKKGQPIGTMTHFSIDGVKYMARDEVHKHPPTDNVPPGLKKEHHGITIYEVIEPGAAKAAPSAGAGAGAASRGGAGAASKGGAGAVPSGAGPAAKPAGGPLRLGMEGPVDRKKYRPLRRVTREIVQKANEILKKGQAIGTMTHFSIAGIKYMARDEVHKHPPTDNVPPGLKKEHHGITIYEVIEP